LRIQPDPFSDGLGLGDEKSGCSNPDVDAGWLRFYRLV
jgi:hypothetical protein